jgi:hypothetical protein
MPTFASEVLIGLSAGGTHRYPPTSPQGLRINNNNNLTIGKVRRCLPC